MPELVMAHKEDLNKAFLDSDEILKRAVFIPININMKDDTPFILLNSLKIALKS
jgi:hypothetical protein